MVSARKALLGRIVKQFVGDEPTVLERIVRVFSKKENPVEKYQDEFNDVLPLLKETVDGKTLHYKPKPEEYYEELISQSHILDFEQFLLGEIIEKADVLFQAVFEEKIAKENTWFQGLVHQYEQDLHDQITQVRSENVYKTKNQLETMISKVNGLKKNNYVTEEIGKQLQLDDIDYEVERRNKFSNRFSRQDLPSYTTGWVEYRSDDYIDQEDTTPGHDRKRLEAYYNQIMDELIPSFGGYKTCACIGEGS